MNLDPVDAWSPLLSSPQECRGPRVKPSLGDPVHRGISVPGVSSPCTGVNSGVPFDASPSHLNRPPHSQSLCKSTSLVDTSSPKDIPDQKNVLFFRSPRSRTVGRCIRTPPSAGVSVVESAKPSCFSPPLFETGTSKQILNPSFREGSGGREGTGMGSDSVQGSLFPSLGIGPGLSSVEGRTPTPSLGEKTLVPKGVCSSDSRCGRPEPSPWTSTSEQTRLA